MKGRNAMCTGHKDHPVMKSVLDNLLANVTLTYNIDTGDLMFARKGTGEVLGIVRCPGEKEKWGVKD